MKLRLRDILKQQKISGAELARMIGVTPVYISRVVNGKTIPSINKCVDIAQALGVPVAALFDDYGTTVICPYCGNPIHITKDEH